MANEHPPGGSTGQVLPPPNPPPAAVISVTRRFTFSAAHRYARPDWSEAQNRERYGSLATIHGHTYTLEVTVRGTVDPVTGIGVDLAELKRLAADSVVRRFDHAFLNDDPAFVSGVVPTTENLVRVIWDLLRDKLGADRLARIRLWEDPTLHVEYAGEA